MQVKWVLVVIVNVQVSRMRLEIEYGQMKLHRGEMMGCGVLEMKLGWPYLVGEEKRRVLVAIERDLAAAMKMYSAETGLDGSRVIGVASDCAWSSVSA
jgi:hypothetical protein